MPDSVADLGQQAVEFAARAGLFLDPWQQDVLKGSLGLAKGGKWAARNVGLLVPRQNGKGAVLEARELFGMFVLNEPLIIHSAHRFDTSQEHFLRMRNLIDGNPDLSKHVKSVYTANGKESIELRNGCRLKFKARTLAGGGRGFSCDCLVLDEAMLLPEQALSAMSPTMLARKNPQTWFTSSAGTPESDALWRLVRQGRSQAPRLAYFEWGLPTGSDPADQANWIAANPGVPHRLPLDELENEFGTLTAEDFAREHLGIWDDQASSGAFPPGSWEAAADPTSQITGPATYGLAVPEDRAWGCVAAVGLNAEGLWHGECGRYQQQTTWIVPYLADLASRRRVRVVVRPGSPAGSLISELEQARVEVVKASTQDYAQFCGQMHDAVAGFRNFRHLNERSLNIAVQNAEKRVSGDSFVWDLRKSSTDISPLEAVTLAAGGARQKPPSGRFMSL